MFTESIKRLVKIRRYVDKTNLEHLQEDNWLSTIADEVTFSLTLAIKDLERLNQALNKKGINKNGI